MYTLNTEYKEAKEKHHKAILEASNSCHYSHSLSKCLFIDGKATYFWNVHKN
jgi:hypothetical protein